MMIGRKISSELKQLLAEYPVVTLLGPRQSGKTTLAQSLPGYEYCNLEIPENREFASHDPKAFLKQFEERVVLDEIQRVPQLLSYIQAIVDTNKRNGEFVLTGSHQLELHAAITQSLAGRTGILHLLPFSICELNDANIGFDDFEEYVYHGFLPRIYDQKQRPTQAYSNYYQTYVERDVRQLINLKDVSLFEKFIKLVAGRIGQLVNFNSLSNDVGVDAKTIKHWLSILEASFIIYKLPPYFESFGKRVIKSPKYYFTDVGLLCFLLGIEKPSQICRDPLVGNIFENLVVIECLKARYNQGKLANLYFFRDSAGNEVDIVFQQGRNLTAIECKSASTYTASAFKGLDQFNQLSSQVTRSCLVYNGEAKELSGNRYAVRFSQVDSIFDECG
ncbi:MAG: ATP-binding protein [Gammaproteobacteria bacterium]|nr:ATP-binding protein [Gammaproteobacteria bacterium]MDH5801606.1 ATP-binding protein [Gammaproteobacteria bacterium]